MSSWSLPTPKIFLSTSSTRRSPQKYPWVERLALEKSYCTDKSHMNSLISTQDYLNQLSFSSIIPSPCLSSVLPEKISGIMMADLCFLPSSKLGFRFIRPHTPCLNVLRRHCKSCWVLISTSLSGFLNVATVGVIQLRSVTFFSTFASFIRSANDLKPLFIPPDIKMPPIGLSTHEPYFFSFQ